MTYEKLLQGLSFRGTVPAGEAVIVTQDSRKVVPGAVFVCVEGRTSDGHAYAEKALGMGAGLLVTQRPLGLPNEVLVPHSREAYSLLCQAFFAYPAKELTLIAVTGTNGKTTVSTILKQVLEQNGFPCGLIGTIHTQIGEVSIPAKFTTPEAWDLHALLKRMLAAGCTHVVMEASSQALEQQRLYGIHFDLSIFTNLTQDHLDYHGDMQNYFEAKRILFSQSGRMLVNADDKWGKLLLQKESAAEKIAFSVKDAKARFMAHHLELRPGGVSFTLETDVLQEQAYFPMPGEYSVYNALAAAGAAMLLGCTPQKVLAALRNSHGVAGRCEVLLSGAFTVICDFAHTGDAIEKLLSALRPFAVGRMFVLFGCPGSRDRTKRIKMADAAAAYGDILFLTSDNPRAESTDQIFEDTLPSLRASGKPYFVEEDREKALKMSLDMLQKNDMLILCGKGHEDYQVLDGVTIYFSERQIVSDWLQKHPAKGNI